MAQMIKRYGLEEVVPNMRLGRDLLSRDGQIILREGTVLTAGLIKHLRCWGFSCIDIIREEPDRKVEQGNCSPDEQFIKDYLETANQIKMAFESIRFCKEVPIPKMRELADQSILPFVYTPGIINYLHTMRSSDDYTFRHSVNVAIVSGVLGKWLGYKGCDLKDLILAGLLHDVGKTQIPLSILNKPGALSDAEMDVIKQHPILGFELIQAERAVPHSVACGVLQHHERMHGGGYPYGRIGVDIHPTARIVAVADIYDAMTSDRVYRASVSPFQVVEVLVDEMYHKLDMVVCRTLLDNMRHYLVGNVVLLSDGRRAEVVIASQFALARPIVRTSDGEFIDLEYQKDISIIKLLSA